MNYTELYDAVVGITNRPELSGDITTAIQRSTLKMHFLEFWKFDLILGTFNLVSPAYNFQLTKSTTFPLFRQLAFLRNYDLASGDDLQVFNKIEPDVLMDQYGNKFKDVYFTSGNFINVRSSSIVSTIDYGFYQRPVISPTGSYSSYIAQEYPFAIIDDACSSIFKTVGLDDKMKKFDGLVLEHIQLLKQNYLEEQAR